MSGFVFLLKIIGKFILLALLVICCLGSCKRNFSDPAKVVVSFEKDSLTIDSMIRIRERAMINKDIASAMTQFSDHATWINSQGYYFEGKKHILEFHNMLAGNDSLDYYYKAGKPKIRIIDSNNALAYYGWKMFWYKKEVPTDTTYREIGLMTLTAHKTDRTWQWIAVTNQHTPWFYEEILPVSID